MNDKIIMFEAWNQIWKKSPKISDQKKKRVHLSLLQNIFWISRQAIKNECSKKKIDLSNENQVAIYIKEKIKWQIK